MIHCFGNSHTSLFTGQNIIHSKAIYGGHDFDILPDFRTYPMGAIVCYNFTQNHFPKMMEYINSADVIGSDDYIMLMVGEVDCRWHIPFQAKEQGVSLYVIIKECIDRYFESIEELNKNRNVIIWGVHPSTNTGHNNDPSNPVFGDVITRNKIAEDFNIYLTMKCSKEGIPFVSIFKHLVNFDLTTKMEYFRDYCHLDKSCLEFALPEIKNHPWL
jgi:hypothetical protein